MATAPKPRKDTAATDEVTIGVDGQPYTLRLGEMTAALVRELRAETGRSFTTFMGDLGGSDPDLDVIAVIVWLARRQAGETVTLADVEAGLTYGNVDLTAPPPVEVGDPDPNG